MIIDYIRLPYSDVELHEGRRIFRVSMVGWGGNWGLVVTMTEVGGCCWHLGGAGQGSRQPQKEDRFYILLDVSEKRVYNYQSQDSNSILYINTEDLCRHLCIHITYTEFSGKATTV